MKTYLLAISALLMSVSSFAGRVDTLSIFSEGMHKNVKCVVITPAGYSKTGKRYPVVYLLHGYSDNYAGWLEKTHSKLKTSVDDLQMILVCPDGGYNSWYFDSEIDTTVKYESFVSRELVSYIDKHYRTVNSREGRAITGLSMGGHGALYLSIRHKDVYGAAGSTSGGVDILPFPDQWDIKKVLGDTSCCLSNWQNNTVMHVADSLRNGELKLIIDCGTQDFFIGVNRRFHQRLLEHKIDHDYIERPGAHNNEYWNNSIDFQLLFFRKFFLYTKR